MRPALEERIAGRRREHRIPVGQLLHPVVSQRRPRQAAINGPEELAASASSGRSMRIAMALADLVISGR